MWSAVRQEFREGQPEVSGSEMPPGPHAGRLNYRAQRLVPRQGSGGHYPGQGHSGQVATRPVSCMRVRRQLNLGGIDGFESSCPRANR